jgi:hypothetical protein
VRWLLNEFGVNKLKLVVGVKVEEQLMIFHQKTKNPCVGRNKRMNPGFSSFFKSHFLIVFTIDKNQKKFKYHNWDGNNYCPGIRDGIKDRVESLMLLRWTQPLNCNKKKTVTLSTERTG